MTDNRITKVKFIGEALEVHLEGTEEDYERKATVKSLGSVHPDLKTAMQALAPDVRKLLCLPKAWASNAFVITGASFSYSEKTHVDGIVFSCRAELATFNAPLCFNTPYLPVIRHTEEGEEELEVEEATALKISTLKDEIFSYLEGKRAQGEFELENEEAQ